MESNVRQLAGLAILGLGCCFVAFAVRANIFALIFGAETAVTVLSVVLIAK
jgi:hypothetical protein